MLGRDIARADSFDALHIDRTFERGLQPARSASEINQWALFRR